MRRPIDFDTQRPILRPAAPCKAVSSRTDHLLINANAVNVYGSVVAGVAES